MGPVQWIQRAFSEAPFGVWRDIKDEPEEIVDHPMTKLIETPNGFYGNDQLWMASLFSWCITGNVYWTKIRNGANKPVELWYIPPWLIEPKWPLDRRDVFISHYEYNPGGETIILPPEDVIHFRHGFDPNNLRLGVSPIQSVIREVWSDDEASNFVASLLRNGGVPGVIVTPKEGSVMGVDIDAVKEYFREMFTGDRRGEPLALTGPTDVHQFGFNPQQLDLSSVRNTAEERVCALLGIPAAVVGFGSGLEATKVGATMSEMRKLAWMNGIIPLQKIFAGTLDNQLLPDFTTTTAGVFSQFDNEKVVALQEDRNDLFKRADVGIKGGWLTVAAGKRMVGMEALPGDEVYLRSIATVEISATGARPPVVDPNAPKGNGHDPTFKQDTQQQRTQALLRGLRAMDKLIEKISAVFADALEKEFLKLGTEAARAAGETLEKGANGIGRPRYRLDPVLGSKQVDEVAVDLDVEKIINGIAWSTIDEAMLLQYQGTFGLVLEETFGGMNSAIGLAANLPDSASVRILADGGRKLGLLDLKEQTRKNLFKALAESREIGEGADAIARRIRDQIPKGPWRDVQTRARVIARTETKYAQNRSMMEYTRASGATQARVFDARLGDTDAECEARADVIVSMAQAEEWLEGEHPNGTLSITPWFEATE